MLAFKTADLKFQQESSYTTAPSHNLKSITASAIRFLDHNASRTLSPAQPVDMLHVSMNKCDVVLEGLRFELDIYLHEPRMDHFKATTQDSESGVDIELCNPLRYWAVRIFPHFEP